MEGILGLASGYKSVKRERIKESSLRAEMVREKIIKRCKVKFLCSD
jgi:hypothetical protein